MTTARRFKWWYKGRTKEGNTARFEGDGWASDCMAAFKNIEKMMREKHPDIKWMHGNKIEGEDESENVKFGPTVRMLKATKAQ